MKDDLVVLDASALLALLLAEPGAVDLVGRIPKAVVSAVNLSEVVAKLAESGMPDDAIRLALEGLNLTVLDFDATAAFEAGALRRYTKHLGLSLGDRACLALARQLDRIAVTTDRQWARLDLGIRIELIR